MRIERWVETRYSKEQAQEQIAAYLQQVGYQLEEAGAGLVFKRGSRLGTWTSFSPRKWYARVTIEFAPGHEGGASPEPAVEDFSHTAVVITIDVDTSGQMVTRGEREFWAQEIGGLVRALQGEVVDAAAIPRSPKRLRWQEVLPLVGLMLLGIAVGIAIKVLLHAQYVGMGVGAGICVWALLHVLGVEREPKV